MDSSRGGDALISWKAASHTSGDPACHTGIIAVFILLHYARLAARADTRRMCRRETHCEFCDRQLPDWKRTLTPTCGADAPAVMNVNFDGRTYRCVYASLFTLIYAPRGPYHLSLPMQVSFSLS